MLKCTQMLKHLAYYHEVTKINPSMQKMLKSIYAKIYQFTH